MHESFAGSALMFSVMKPLALARGPQLLLFCVMLLYIKQCNCVRISKFTALKIQVAISRFEEDCSVCLLREWPPIRESLTPVAEEYTSPPIMLWNVLKTYSGIIGSLLCPFCERQGHSSFLVRSGIWTDGTPKSSYQPRTIYDSSGTFLLVSGVYICINNHQVPSHNPQILSKLPSTVYVPFLLTNRGGFSMDLITQICSLVDHGLSFLSIEDIIRDQYQQSYCRRRSRYEEDARQLGKENVTEFPAFEQTAFPFPHDRGIRDAFSSYSALYDQMFHDDMTCRTSEWVFCDHTFKSAANIGFVRESDGKWIKLFKCVFVILGKGGEVLHWKFTRGESFEEVRDIFMQLKERLLAKKVNLKGVVVDNCCKWKFALNTVFPDAEIKLDLFHAVQRFLKTLPVGARIGSGIAKEYGLIFRRPSDLGEKRTQPTADKDTILKNLAGFEKKWSNKKWNERIILNTEAKKAIKNLKTHIEKGCLSDIPIQCSTSGNERIHRHMNSILHTNRIGLDLAYYRCSRLFFRINNANKSMLASKFCHPMLKKSNISESFGVSRNITVADGKTALLKVQLTSGNGKSIQRLSSSNLAYIKNVLQSCITSSNSTVTEDHLYCSANTDTHYTALEIALQAIIFYEVYIGLSNLGGSRFMSKSRLPSSIGLENISVEKIRSLNDSNESTEDEQGNARETLTAHAQGFGLSILPVAGDGNCFFSSVAFYLSNLMAISSEPNEVVNHLGSLGLTSNMEITELADALRALVVDEWSGPNAENYMNFIEGDIDFNSEVSKFKNSGYFHGPLGDLMPIAMSNVLNLPLCIITSESHTPVISICPQQAITGSLPIILAYTSTGPGHYDAMVSANKQNGTTGQFMKLT